MSRRKSVSPHDATGANLVVQVKNHRVMRVVPFENDAINECWIADRDRFSYEALNGEDRLTQPMVKQGGEWIATDWASALDYIVRGLQDVHHTHGAAALGALASPHSTVEELHLMTQLIRALGSDNIDARLRAAEPASGEGVRWLGMPLSDLSQLDRVLVVGGNLRKDQPLMAQRIRQATRRGAQVSALNEQAFDWAMPVQHQLLASAGDWVQVLAGVASAVATLKGVPAPVQAQPNEVAQAIAQSLCSGERKAVLLGNAAAHHVRASGLLALAQWIGQQTGAAFGYLGEAANTVGAQVVGAQPSGRGQSATQMLQAGALKAVFLLNTEPGLDTAASADGLSQAGLVVSLSPFKTNLDVADVLLPISPFTETAGTFINTEGRAQSFHGVVRPLGETRPAWKVLRVLGQLLGLKGFDFETVEQVRQAALPEGWAQRLSNATQAAIDVMPVDAKPVTAGIYELDALVRRAPALQRTADAKGGQ
jgi:NADH-quinone oxidoreductase subunit G